MPANACCKPLPQAACHRCRADVAAIAVGGPGGGEAQIYVTMAPGRCLPGARARGITQLAACYATVGPTPGPIVPGGSWACPSRASPPTRGRDAGRCLPGAHAGGIIQPAVLYPVGPRSWPNARRHVSWACASRSSPPALATHIQLIAQSAPQLQCLGGRRAHEGSGPQGTSGGTLPSEGRNAGSPATRARPTAGKPRSAGMGAGHG